MLLFLTTNMATMMSRANQQFMTSFNPLRFYKHCTYHILANSPGYDTNLLVFHMGYHRGPGDVVRDRFFKINPLLTDWNYWWKWNG